jgi:hypothetical protein
MPNELPVPEDLLHLIEKRGVDERRKNPRRTTTAGSTAESTSAAAPTQAAAETAEAPPNQTPEKSPSRRKQSDPRSSARRNSDRWGSEQHFVPDIRSQMHVQTERRFHLARINEQLQNSRIGWQFLFSWLTKGVNCAIRLQFPFESVTAAGPDRFDQIDRRVSVFLKRLLIKSQYLLERLWLQTLCETLSDLDVFG